MKDKLLKAKLLSKYNQGIPTANTGGMGGLTETANTTGGSMEMESATTGAVGGPVPSATTGSPGDILRAIKAKDTGYVPGLKTETMGAQPVPKTYSPVKDYLKKGKRK